MRPFLKDPDPSYEEWSTNLDLDRLPAFLAVIGEWASAGFTDAEVLEVLDAIERMR